MIINEIMEMAERMKLPPELVEEIRPLITDEFLKENESEILALGSPENEKHAPGAEKAWEIVESKYTERTDPRGLHILAVYLAAAVHTKDSYGRLGIGDDILDDTLACFGRFVAETLKKDHVLKYDRGFWTWRQTSLRLFRLGVLEFEYVVLSSEEASKLGVGSEVEIPVLSVHIPSDAKMSPREIADSYRQAEKFFHSQKELCYAGAPVCFYCESWLLAPALKKLLPDGSSILNFQSEYEIRHVMEDDEEFYFWLFDDVKKPPFPANTRLQRKAAAYMEQGGKIGAAAGIRKLEENLH